MFDPDYQDEIGCEEWDHIDGVTIGDITHESHDEDEFDGHPFDSGFFGHGQE